MPIYLYWCSRCNKQFEDLQVYNEPVLGRCPDCTQLSDARILGVPSVQIEGGEKTLGMIAESNNRKIGNSNVKKTIESFKTKKNVRRNH